MNSELLEKADNATNEIMDKIRDEFSMVYDSERDDVLYTFVYNSIMEALK